MPGVSRTFIPGADGGKGTPARGRWVSARRQPAREAGAGTTAVHGGGQTDDNGAPTVFEITNPGEPLADTQRFVDTLPRPRKEALASFMRRFRIYEERRQDPLPAGTRS